jgi:hypothetical protein
LHEQILIDRSALNSGCKGWRKRSQKALRVDLLKPNIRSMLTQRSMQSSCIASMILAWISTGKWFINSNA